MGADVVCSIKWVQVMSSALELNENELVAGFYSEFCAF
jgi:hypothetical protein